MHTESIAYATNWSATATVAQLRVSAFTESPVQVGIVIKMYLYSRMSLKTVSLFVGRKRKKTKSVNIGALNSPKEAKATLYTHLM